MSQQTFPREAFIEWLLKQPDERRFAYYDGRREAEMGCPICNFLRETNRPFEQVNGWVVVLGDEPDMAIPDDIGDAVVAPNAGRVKEKLGLT